MGVTQVADQIDIKPEVGWIATLLVVGGTLVGGAIVFPRSVYTIVHSWSTQNLFDILMDNSSQHVDYSTLHYHDNQLTSTRGHGSVGS